MFTVPRTKISLTSHEIISPPFSVQDGCYKNINMNQSVQVYALFSIILPCQEEVQHPMYFRISDSFALKNSL